MRLRCAVPVLAALLLSGCWQVAAQLSVLTVEDVGGVEPVADTVVTGCSCEGEEGESRAIANAIWKIQGTQALAMTELEGHGKCTVVKGVPVRFVAGAPVLRPRMDTTKTHDGSEVPADRAVVFAYRSDFNSHWTTVNAELALSGSPALKLANGQMRRLLLVPGTYSGEASANLGMLGEPWRVPFKGLKLEAGHVYYLRVTVATTADSAGVASTYRRGLDVQLRAPAFAIADMEGM